MWAFPPCTDPLAHIDLGAMLAEACITYGDTPAVAEGIGRSAPVASYSEVGRRSSEIYDSLCASGVERGEPVVVIVESTSVDFMAMIGCWWAGGVVVPVHASASKSTIDAVLKRTGARLAIRHGIAEPAITRTATLVDEVHPRGNLLNGAAFVIFTSGSTGIPKGVVLSHFGFMGKLRAIQSTLPFAPARSTMMVLKLNFSFGLWVSLLTLATGGTVHLVPRFDPLETLNGLARAELNRVAVVPTMMRRWMSIADSAKGRQAFGTFAAKSQPTLLIAGGEPLSSELGRWFRARLPLCEIADVFGLTETSTSDMILPPHLYDSHTGTIGWPTPGVIVRILDEEGNLAGIGEPGEIQIRSDYIMTCYLGDPETTLATFDGTFLRTGDTGMLNADGTVSLLGRSKELILRGGNKISPLEVERVFAEHPAISAILAAGYSHDILGESVGVLVVPTPGTNPPSPKELIDWAHGKIEGYKMPDRFLFATEIPVGQTGKADRKALSQLLIG